MGWYVWPKDNPPVAYQKCRECGKPMAAGDHFYFESTNPVVVIHTMCVKD